MTENGDLSEPEDSMSAPIRTNYSGNTNKSKESKRPPKDEKNVEKVITGVVVQRKKSLGRKIADTFVGDNMHNVGNFVLYEVIIPAAKSLVSDAVSQGVERSLWGDSRPRSSGGHRRNYISYENMSRSNQRPDRRNDGRREVSYRARANHDFNEIVVPDRGEAEDVLDRLGDLIETYRVATVNDLYDLVGITGNFTDDKWGWDDLRTAHITRVKDGYLLNLPKTSPID